MALKVVVIVLSLIIVHTCADFNLEDLIGQVFNNKSKDQVESTTQRFQPIPTTATTPTEQRGGGGKNYKSCGNQKECVPRHLCVGGSISTDGANLFDIRFDEGNKCPYSQECCDIPNESDEPIIPAVPKDQHEGCGWRNKDGVAYKITGNTDFEAEFGEFPWMVAILRTEDAGGELIHLYDCGGALIAPNAVLTAAHCVRNRVANQLIVRAGEWDTQHTDEILNHVDKSVKEIIIHENHNKGALYNDVALLILSDSFVWQENIRPVCLPPENIKFDHSRCFATGWGKDVFGRQGKYQVILKKIDLPVIPAATCQEQLRQTRLGLYFNLHESFLCAGGEKNKDTCKGDGGSPLVCPIPGVKDRYYQAGIVAWGVGCAEENVPGVYGNVAHLRPWISAKLSERGVNFQHFTP